jgi:hypothetical protein
MDAAKPWGDATVSLALTDDVIARARHFGELAWRFTVPTARQTLAGVKAREHLLRLCA